MTTSLVLERVGDHAHRSPLGGSPRRERPSSAAHSKTARNVDGPAAPRPETRPASHAPRSQAQRRRLGRGRGTRCSIGMRAGPASRTGGGFVDDDGRIEDLRQRLGQAGWALGEPDPDPATPFWRAGAHRINSDAIGSGYRGGGRSRRAAVEDVYTQILGQLPMVRSERRAGARHRPRPRRRQLAVDPGTPGRRAHGPGDGRHRRWPQRRLPQSTDRRGSAILRAQRDRSPSRRRRSAPQADRDQ